eukprot:g2102.t1
MTSLFRRALHLTRLTRCVARIRPLKKRSFRSYSSTGSGNGRGGGTRNSGGKTDIHDGGSSWPIALWTAYLSELERRPVITKMWTSGVLNAVGDLLAQFFIEKEAAFDPKRLLVFTGLGVFLVGPTLHYWYGLLARVFTVPGAKTAFSSLLLDQFAFAPCFCAVFLSTLVVIETRKPALVAPKLQQDFMSTIVMNWRIWIPAQLLNFWIVPPPLRVLFANIVALVWNTYLSYASHKKVDG